MDYEGWGASGQIEWSLRNDLQLVSITAYRKYDSLFSNEDDLSPLSHALGGPNRLTFDSWSQELRPEDSVHTLVAVVTEEGPVGYGSAFTNVDLVRAALAQLEPLYRGASAIEPERTSEILHQNSFWLGRGGTLTHAISAIDIALWDLLGQATGQPVSRLLGGRHAETVRPYASILMREPDALADELARLLDQGFRAFKLGWGPFGRVSARMDEAIVASARAAVGPDVPLMVDAGGSDAFWPNGYKWALRAADMLAGYGIGWFEEPLSPDALAEHLSGLGANRVADADHAAWRAIRDSHDFGLAAAWATKWINANRPGSDCA
jgi:L-alanine-DL-glutamate epimerase-like enolase superfamily enzyme